MKKNIFAILVATSLAFTLMACQSSGETSESGTNIENTTSPSDATPSLDTGSSFSGVDALASTSDAASTGSSLSSSSGITTDAKTGNIGISAILSTGTDIAITY